MPHKDVSEQNARQAEERSTNWHVLIWGTVLVVVALGASALWFAS